MACEKRYVCDLHTHSLFSDGTYTPRELVEEAVQKGISAIALCDHDTIGGIDEFLEAAKGAPLEAVPGIEFSTEYKGQELHIVALYITPDMYDKISKYASGYLDAKDKSNIELISALRDAGYDITHEEIIEKTKKGNFNRAHVAAVLTEHRYTGTVKEAFDTILSEEQGYYKPTKHPSALKTIEFIRSLNAVSILAHPFLSLDEKTLREFLKEAVKCGLCGMETHYSTYSVETAEKSAEIAAEYGLLESGGSDFHGSAKPDISLGTGRGNLAVPLEFAKKIKAVTD